MNRFGEPQSGRCSRSFAVSCRFWILNEIAFEYFYCVFIGAWLGHQTAKSALAHVRSHALFSTFKEKLALIEKTNGAYYLIS